MDLQHFKTPSVSLMNNVKAPIAVALDLSSFAEIERVARSVSPFVSILKVGLQTFYRDGIKATELVRELGCGLFLDLKLHDIPNTVKGACESLAPLRPDYLTVHASGGVAMMKAAVEALPHTKITAVTALTSLAEKDVSAWGDISIGNFANALAESAVEANVGAIVCSGHEVENIRRIVGSEIEIIVPGIRSALAAGDDQQRTMTLTEAMNAGASIAVIGRPITSADDPRSAAEKFQEEFRSIHAK